ncbi:hypothetical protein IAT38_002582 [Cryptococcus sp. DSM 104549]
MSISISHSSPSLPLIMLGNFHQIPFQLSSDPQCDVSHINMTGVLSSKLSIPTPLYALLALVLNASLTAGALYYYHYRYLRPTSTAPTPDYTETTDFTRDKAWIRTLPGEIVQWAWTQRIVNEGTLTGGYRHRLLDESEVEDLLKQKENEVCVDDRKGNPVKKIDIQSLESGTPTEDRWSIDVIKRKDIIKLASSVTGFWWGNWWDTRRIALPKAEFGQTSKGDGAEDIVMCSVMDGHSGWQAAALVKKTIHGCLAWNLGKTFAAKEMGWLEKAGERVWGKVDAEEPSPETICQVIKETFLALDDNITSTLPNIISTRQPHTNPLLPPDQPNVLAAAEMCGAGACCLTTIVDAAADRLYIANTGDARAVAGWWNEKEQKWRCDVLTNDFCGDNPAEIDRIISEHPEEESRVVMFDKGRGNGTRILGMLQPTRAFGDDDYKLEHTFWKRMETVMLQEKFRRNWPHCDECPNKTPPYVTAEPEVVWRDLHPASGEQLKFVAMSTDGLWDRLTSEEASHLLTAHLSQRKQPDILQSDITSLFPHQDPLPEGEHPYPKQDTATDGSWVFEDDNAATHLVRNGLGGADRVLRRQMLSVKKPGVRQVRDDITAMVLWFNDDEPQSKQDVVVAVEKTEVVVAEGVTGTEEHQPPAAVDEQPLQQVLRLLETPP